MKNSIASKLGHISRIGTLTLVALAVWPTTPGQAADIFWTGGTVSYTNAANWTGGVVPGGGDHAINNSGSNNVVQINIGDPDWTVVDLIAGNADNTSGAYVQNGATVKVGNPGGWFRFGVNPGSFGIYTLNGGTLNGVDQIHVGENGTAVLNLNGGTITKSGGQFSISDTATVGASGVMNQTGGIVDSTSEFWVGNNLGTGTFNLSGGSFTNSNWFAVGRFGATGTLIMSGGSITKIGGGNFYVGEGAGVGQFDFSGGTISINSEFWLANGGTSVAVQNMNGTAAMTVGNWIAIGRNGGNGTLNLTNGTITKIGGGNFAIGAGGGAVGVLNQYGGAIINTANPGSLTYLAENGGNGTWNLNSGTGSLGILQFCQGGNGIGTLNLNGGLLSVSEVNCGVAGANGTFYFNGGTLQATGDNANFFHGLGNAYVQAGGAIFDSQGFSVAVAQSLLDLGGGTLTKNGTGTLTLTGANGYTGATIVNAGKLVSSSDSTANGSYTVANGAALGVTVLNAGSQWNQASLTLGTATMDFELGSFGNPTAAPLNVTGALAVNGVVTVNIADDLPQLGQFPLIRYGSRSGSGSFALGSLPPGVVATIVTNAGGSIDLNITFVAAPRWDGQLNGTWDIATTANWIELSTTLAATYADGNAVLFNDLASGTTTVNLGVTVNPAKVTVNNTNLNYSLSGSGKISGTASLIKQGPGSLALNTLNDYTGATRIEGGTVSVTNLANGGQPSAIGSSSSAANNLVLAGGTLSYSGPAASINRGYLVAGGGALDLQTNLTIGGRVTATSGGFTKTGPGTLTYTAATTDNHLSSGGGGGAFVVQSGTVVMDGIGGQTNQVNGEVWIGQGGGSVARVDLVNGSHFRTDTWTVIGRGGGSGMMNVSNATLTHINAWDLIVGTDAGSVGELNLYDNSVINNNAGWFLVGVGGSTGTFNQYGGIYTNSESYTRMYVGRNAGSIGTYNVRNGIVSLGNDLHVGVQAAQGTLNLSNSASFTERNGWSFIGGNFDDAATPASVGTVTLADNSRMTLTGRLYVGFRQGIGTLNLVGGNLTKNSGDPILIGVDAGVGVVNHSAGTNTLPNGEIWIGQGAGGNGTYNLSGSGVLNLNNNWLAVGREGATGFLNISGGSMTKAGGGNISIAHGGGPGTVNQIGGSFTCTAGETWIGEDSNTGTWNMGGGVATLGIVHLAQTASAVGIMNLDGGTLAATEVTTGNAGGTSTLNLNGGTLRARANNANFLHDLTTASVLASGAVIDSGTNNIGIAQALLDGTGGGGLTKQGTGALYLNGANTYTGPTLVNAGTLGGSGSIAGAVTVAAGATLAPGTSIGTLTVGTSLTLAGNAVMEVSKDGGVAASDLASVTGNLAFGGTLSVVVTGTNILAVNDTFNLFDWGTRSGSFTATNLPANYSWDLSQLTVNGTIRISAVLIPPTVNPPAIVGGNLVLTGTGGIPGGSYTWLTATNVAAPAAQWTTNTVGTFDGSGAFSNALPVTTSEAARFFRLRVP